MLTKNQILNLFKTSKSMDCFSKIFHILIHRQADISIFNKKTIFLFFAGHSLAKEKP